MSDFIDPQITIAVALKRLEILTLKQSYAIHVSFYSIMKSNYCNQCKSPLRRIFAYFVTPPFFINRLFFCGDHGNKLLVACKEIDNPKMNGYKIYTY